MDPFDIMFDKDKPFTPIVIRGGTTNGRIAKLPNPTAPERLQSIEKDAWAHEISVTKNKLQRMLQVSRETSEGFEENALGEHDDNDIYGKYKFEGPSRDAAKLPVYALKDKIIKTIAASPSVVIEGSTGCGKSTQIPQMILDDAKANRRPCNIIVTQPRRIAARSIAERVANERNWPLGSVVGYQIGLDKNFVSEDTRLLFCTTGVLLEKLIQTKSMTQFTHIVLDEVHERDKDMDFLFIIIRMLMAEEHSNVKIILMSATFDSQKFAKYFWFQQFGQKVPAPILKVDRNSLYTVSEFYLDDFEQILPKPAVKRPEISNELYKFTVRLIVNLKSMEEKKKNKVNGTILIFLPGIYEIGRLRSFMMEHNEAFNWKIFILHSLISTEEQQMIFKPLEEEGLRKIILSTNIAESSITVPDVKYVIDFCLMKYLKCDPTKNFTSLEIDWASKSNCIQRAGRAGRVANGRCYRMVERRFYEGCLKDSATPELLLASLENVVLKAKTFNMGPPHVVLGLAMDPPKLEDVANTVLALKDMGAMQLTLHNEQYSAIDGELTFLGRMMAGLPVDVRASRMIAIGFCYGVLDECIIMAAGLTAKSIFKISFERNLDAYTRKLEWSNGSGSDLFSILNAYRVWETKHNQGIFGKRNEQQKTERDFCRKHYLDVRSLHECHQLVKELRQRLDKIGIREAAGLHRIHWTHQEKNIILKVVIAGAFYPNFFSTPPITNPMMERDVFHSLNGRDPENTVFFTGFRPDHIRQLYVDKIRKLFSGTVVLKDDIDSIKVSFEPDSEKVFVTFDPKYQLTSDVRVDWETKRCSLPGKALTEVYKAIKMRKMNMNTQISVFKLENEKEEAEKLGLGVMTGLTFTLKQAMKDDIHDICLPRATVKEVLGTITHVENCSKFWLQPETEVDVVKRYKRELNQNPLEFMEQCDDYLKLTRDTIIVAHDHSDGKFYRARLTGWDHDTYANIFKGSVRFLDSGHSQKVQMSDLYIFKKDIEQANMPPRCFECRLAEIQPSTANISGGYTWSKRAIEKFQELVHGRHVKAEIYSVTNGVANVFIWADGFNLNEYLIKSGHGEFYEENFLSKSNRWRRQDIQNYASAKDVDLDKLALADCEEYFPIACAEPIKEVGGDRLVFLKGPRSPLESQVHSVMPANGSRAVIVDANSVNSVYLTSMQQDLSMKYMVAAHISERGVEHKEYSIQETTLLPIIRGFGPLMAMIFCRSMDLKRDKCNSRYISLRTGLGYDKDKECPYYEERDTIFPLDFEFTQDDLETINQIRYNIDSLLYTIGNKNPNETLTADNKFELMSKLKEITIKLLIKQRKAIEVNTVMHQWSRSDDDFEKPGPNPYGHKAIFPWHGLVRVRGISNEAKRGFQRHCAELRSLTFSMPRSTRCELCETEIENIAMLRNHLMTRLHMDREKEIGFSEGRSNSFSGKPINW